MTTCSGTLLPSPGRPNASLVHGCAKKIANAPGLLHDDEMRLFPDVVRAESRSKLAANPSRALNPLLCPSN